MLEGDKICRVYKDIPELLRFFTILSGKWKLYDRDWLKNSNNNFHCVHIFSSIIILNFIIHECHSTALLQIFKNWK